VNLRKSILVPNAQYAAMGSTTLIVISAVDDELEGEPFVRTHLSVDGDLVRLPDALRALVEHSRCCDGKTRQRFNRALRELARAARA
jgi:hypothetical protein